MPKPFWIQRSRRNFVGSGRRASGHQVEFDRRVDWTSRIPKPPPPPGPEYLILSPSGEVVCSGGTIELDHQAIALIYGQPGNLQLFGSAGVLTANQTLQSSLDESVLSIETPSISGTVAQLWTPTPDKHLLAWYDAQDLSTIEATGGGPPTPPSDTITKLRNKSIWGTHLGSTFADPPWRESGWGTINSKGTVVLEGVTEVMASLHPTVIEWHDMKECSIYCALNVGGAGWIIHGNTSGFRLGVVYDNGYRLAFGIHNGSNWVDVVDEQPITPGSVNVFANFQFLAPGYNVVSLRLARWRTGFYPRPHDYHETTPLMYTWSDPVGLPIMYVGDAAADNLGIGEVLIYNRVMNDYEQIDRMNYLSRKWGY